MKTILLTLVLSLSTSLYADDYEKRLEAAYAFYEVYPFTQQWEDGISITASQLPVDAQSKKVIRMMRYDVDLKTLESSTASVLAKEMTVDELQALARVYSSDDSRAYEK